MTITVRLRRNKVLRPSKAKPVIKGHIVGAGGAEGDNIIAPGIRDVEGAKASARDFIEKNFRGIKTEITFEEPEAQ